MRLILTLLVSFFFSSAAFAEEAATAQPQQPTAADLEIARKAVFDDLNNLDKRFQLGQIAFTLGKYTDAKDAYEFMLLSDPSLDRVKLELAMTELKLGNLKRGLELFREVLAKNPPDAVRKNIETVMKQVEDELKPSKFSGSLSTGFNRDTNANSASSTGNVLFNNTQIPLDSTSTAKADNQVYGAGVLTHIYRFDADHPEKNNRYYWNSNATVYGTEQQDIDALNLYLISLKTGPSVNIKDLRLTLGANAGFSYINLDGYKYMDILSGEVYSGFAANEKMNFQLTLGYEDRDFHNSPSITTLEDRTGSAYQAKLDFAYIITPKDLLSANAVLRRESAQTDYLKNDQWSLGGSYIHTFTDTIYGNLGANYRQSNYDSPDAFVSSTITREDKEKTYSAGLGKRLTPFVTWSAGYTFTDVDSSIENYAYRNSKYSTSLGWSF